MSKMNRKNVYILFLLVAATGLSLPTTHAAEGAEGKTRPPLLINVDEELVGYVRQAETLVAGKDYAGAIEILQALLNRSEQCFVPTEDPNRFVSLATRVHEVIGQLPPEGMKVYRQLHDPRAGRLFRAAAGRLDESALRDIVRRYFHTSYSDDALDLLGAIMFDRGEFSQAARCWMKIISASDGKESAILLARISVAHHFAGESKHASKILDLLIKRHPKTIAAFGGRDENVVAFTRRMLAKPPSAKLRRINGWTSLAGAPGSVAVMSPCKPALSVRWTVPGGELADNPNIKAARDSIARTYGYGPTSVGKPLQGGRILYTNRYSGRVKLSPMPALIHPVIAGSLVLYRSAENIAAHDLLTGEKVWETYPFGVYRLAEKNRTYYAMPHFMAMVDQGQWTLTAGDGKVFAVGRFLPDSAAHYEKARYLGRRFADTSVLAAFSLAKQGRLLWRLGEGKGNSNLIREGRFMTAPTYVTGRLYVLIEYKQAYHLVCLDAENGRLVWKATVAQMPTTIASRYAGFRNSWQGRAGPPAVANGRVFVTTNAGAMAAFDIETGQPLWAYEYDSTVNSRRIRRDRRGRFRFAKPPSYPPSPIIVTDGRVICLPADSERLLAFRTDTGKLDWSIDRRGQRDLTAVNHSRLLLSGGGLRIIDAATGKNVWKGEKITDIHGRPAVTTDAILASGKGEIVRVSLKDFSVTRLPVKQPGAILGNLISAGGKLIAANAAGVSAYFPAASTGSNQE